jgi:hypothetical protein
MSLINTLCSSSAAFLCSSRLGSGLVSFRGLRAHDAAELELELELEGLGVGLEWRELGVLADEELELELELEELGLAGFEGVIDRPAATSL